MNKTILNVWTFNGDILNFILRYLNSAWVFFSLIALLGYQFNNFQNCNIVIICTLYMHICKCNLNCYIYAICVPIWTTVYTFYIKLSVCRIWELVFYKWVKIIMMSVSFKIVYSTRFWSHKYCGFLKLNPYIFFSWSIDLHVHK